MDSFIVSARKYRPITFDSVVGQQTITSTLKNAIKNNHLAQAYLFCGPRGVGKTTCARIFAKSINCQTLTSQIEPCNECESCKAFNENRSYNVHEMDAASNNSVDDIRQLIEMVRVPPPIGRYSVYVIDEVHMLSQMAFNAFLKTLEEPPRHAIFILATTEKHKILPTILSRCQIYDFNRIQINDIVQHLARISEKEGNKYDLDGLNIIAQKAEGALRDALSIYDQIVSFSNGQVTYENVIQSLNVLDYEYYFRITDAFINANVTEVFLALNEILNKGFHIPSLIDGLLQHMRSLLVVRDKQSIHLLETSENIRKRYLSQSAQCSIDFLYDALEILSDCELHLKERRDQRLYLEVTFVKICRLVDKKKTHEFITTDDSPDSKTKSQEVPIININKTSQESNVVVPTSTTTALQTNVNDTSVANYTPSLKEILSQVEKKKTVNKLTDKSSDKKHTTTIRNNSFSAESLIAAYQRFIESIKNTYPRFYSALLQIPKVDDSNRLIIEMDNQMILRDFQQEMYHKLLQYLCDELSNDNIVIEAILIKDMKGEKIPFTSEERMKYFMSKNEAVAELKKLLNLDIE